MNINSRELHGNGNSANTAVIRKNVAVIPRECMVVAGIPRGWFDIPAVILRSAHDLQSMPLQV